MKKIPPSLYCLSVSTILTILLGIAMVILASLCATDEETRGAICGSDKSALVLLYIGIGIFVIGSIALVWLWCMGLLATKEMDLHLSTIQSEDLTKERSPLVHFFKCYDFIVIQKLHTISDARFGGRFNLNSQ